MTIMGFCFFFIPSGLFVYHTYLCMTNQTTWEASKRHKITYLMNLPYDVIPFDRGLFNNIVEFSTMTTTRIWKITNTEPQKRKQWNILISIHNITILHICNNKYYDCC